MEVPSTKKVDWYQPDSGDHIYIPVSKINTFKPVNTEIVSQANINYQNQENFIEVIKPKRVMSRPNSPRTLTSPSVPKRYKVDHITPIKLKNRFEPLVDKKVNQETRHISNENIKIAIIIPPIFLSADNFQEITTSEYTTKQCYSKIKIHSTSTDDFRNVTKLYDNDHVKYFTFLNPEARPLSVVMRGVPYSISEEEVKNELLKLNFLVISATRLLKKSITIDGQDKIKSPTPLLALDLQKNDMGKSIFNQERFFYSVVSVEPRRRSFTIPQYTLWQYHITYCQRYNHTKNFCRLEPRCVKCAGYHNFKDRLPQSQGYHSSLRELRTKSHRKLQRL
jgi:hypothetical protein